MFDRHVEPTVVAVRAVTAGLAQLGPGLTDPERIDLIRALEELKCAAAGAQAEISADFDVSQRAEQAAAGVAAERRGRGVALQVAFARRESHHRGQQDLGLAKILRDELPCTREALRAGRVSEWKAKVVARETGCLSREDRRRVDLAVAGDPAQIEAMGDRELEAACKKLAYRLDPHSFVERSRRAEADRRITIRPAPDTMVHLSALLPVAQGVAAYAALKARTDSATAAGDPRTRGQVMADTLVERLTGQASADAVPIEVGVVMSDRVMFGLDNAAARIRGYGPVPAGVARALAATASAEGLAVLRRLYAAPTSGQLVGADSRSRRFPEGLADLIRQRDEDICSNLWCGAPVRPIDHARAAVEGGETSRLNGQGLCEACNIAKEAPGWQARAREGPDVHAVTTTTPTGHAYTSTAPVIRTEPQVYPLTFWVA